MKKLVLFSVALLTCISSMNAQDAWTPAVTGGFDNHFNDAITSSLVFNGKIYAGTGSDSGSVFSSSTGNPGTWSKVLADPGYNNIDAMGTTAESGGIIYVSENTFFSSIKKVVKSDDGVNWVPYFNSINNRIRKIISFNGTGTNDSIYLVVEGPGGDWLLKSYYNSNDPDNISAAWDTVLDFNSASLYDRINCITECNNKLFFGTSHGELFSSVDGNNWVQNAGAGIGFSNPNNTELLSIQSLGAYIYVGTNNYSDGAQIWRSNDETIWNMAYQFPVSESRATSLNTIGTTLWATTYIFGGNGQHIYKTNNGTSYIASNSNGFGQDNNGLSACIFAFGNNIYSSCENFNPAAAPVIGINTMGGGGQIWRLCTSVPTPVVVTPPSATYCGNLSSPPVFTASGGFTSYMWEGFAPTASNTHGFPTGGSHFVCAVDGNGCSSFDTITVTLMPTPTSTVITPSPIAPSFNCAGNPTSITTSTSSNIRNPFPVLSSTNSEAILDGFTSEDSMIVSGVYDDGLLNNFVDVTIDSLYHTENSDLSITLVAPNGSSMLLAYGIGPGSQNFIGTSFTQNASTWIGSGTGPFTGSYLAYDPYYYINGPTNGTWKIIVYDMINTNTGFLKGWSLHFSVADTNMTYAWSATGLSSTTTANTISTATSTTAYSLLVTNSLGCKVTDTVNISVPNVQIITADSSSVCFGSSLDIVATGGSNLVWSPLTSLTSVSSNTVNTTTATYITYYVTDTTTGCVSNDSIHIFANPAIIVNPGLDQTICFADTVFVSGSATGGTPGYSYVWDYNSFTYPGQNVGIESSTEGPVGLTVTDAVGCTANNALSLFLIPSTDVYGHVNYYGGSLTTGTNTAVIYRYLPYLTHFDTVQVQPVNAAGDYHFTSINHGDYLIKIYVDTVLHADLDDTYYGNHWAWDSSTVVVHDCSVSDTADITMIHELGTGSGPGFLRGIITEGLGFGHAPTDPIPGVDVHLGRNPGGAALINTTTDPTGHYYFDNVALNAPGQHYTVYVDIPGLGRDSSYSVVLDATNNQYLYLDYFVDSTTVYIVPNAGVGISNPAMAAENKFTVFPNPFQSNTTIEYSIAADADVMLNVYNVLGTKINTITNGKQQAGNYKYSLSNLNAGVYFITLSVDKKVSTQRVIVIE